MSEEIENRGPDPVWGVGMFVVGLLVMATGGAFTWHYVFNVGEGVMMLGAIVFLAAVVMSWHHQREGGVLGAFEDWKATMPWPRRAEAVSNAGSSGEATDAEKSVAPEAPTPEAQTPEAAKPDPEV